MDGSRSIIKQKSFENKLFTNDAAERAVFQYGVATRTIFIGGMRLKKMGNESNYRNRLIWIDAQDKSFHWSKKANREDEHKSISLIDDVQTVEFGTCPKKYGTLFGGEKPEPSLCMTFVLYSGECIDIQLETIPEAKEWEQVLKEIMSNKRDSPVIEMKTANGEPSVIVPDIK